MISAFGVDHGGISKADSRKVKAGAETAAGAGLITTAVSANRIVDAGRNAAIRGVDIGAEIARNKAMGADRKFARPSRPNSENLAGARASAKAKRQAAGKINEINRGIKPIKASIIRNTSMKTRAGVISTGFLVGLPLAWHGTRQLVPQRVKKGFKSKIDNHDVDAGMAGAAAGAGLYQGAMYSTKPYDRKIEARQAKMRLDTKDNPLAAHRKVHGVDPKTSRGDTKWLKFYRSYPKELPGWKFKRAMSYLHGGKSQVAITAAAAAAGAGAGMAINRKIDPKPRRVSKTLTAKETGQLDRRRRAGRDLSLVGGTLGLSALGLRTPAGAKLALRGVQRVGKPDSTVARGLARFAAKEQRATKLSNTTGIFAIGSGAAGSFNYASQQRLERKRDANLVKSAMGNIPRYGKVARVGHARIMDYRNGRFRIDYKGMDPNVQHWVPRKDIAFYGPKKTKAPKIINPPKPKQAPSDTQETLF